MKSFDTKRILKAGNLKLIYKGLTCKMIGIVIKIHKELGPKNVPFQNQVPIEIEYRGKKLNKKYRADFVIDNTDCIYGSVWTDLNRFYRFQRSFTQSV